MNKYFAFLEDITKSNKQLTFTFDCMNVESYRKVGDTRSITTIPTFTIKVDFASHKKEFKNVKKLKINTWHYLSLSRDEREISCTVINHSDTLDATAQYIEKLTPLKRGSSENKYLVEKISLNTFAESNIETITRIINSAKNDNFVIRAVGVGQGSSIAATDVFECQDSFYVDVGRDIRKRCKINPKFRPKKDAFVILTHWDKDHWLSALHENKLKKIKWIVPKQGALGISHMKLASELHLDGNLIIWPDNLMKIAGNVLDIHKLRPHKNRNLSGLVVICQNEQWTSREDNSSCKAATSNNIKPNAIRLKSKWDLYKKTPYRGTINKPLDLTYRIVINKVSTKGSIHNPSHCLARTYGKNLLITGDAPYKRCKFIKDYQLDALIIPHHGGLFKHERYPMVTLGNIAVVSYGAENIYKHPHNQVINSHEKNGWEIHPCDSDCVFIIHRHRRAICQSCALDLKFFDTLYSVKEIKKTTKKIDYDHCNTSKRARSRWKF